MPSSEKPIEMFKNAMLLFQNKEYLDAREKFARVLDIDFDHHKELPVNCLILRSALYSHLSSAALSGNRKNLSNILDITYDDADFRGLQTVYLRQFMTDLKDIMTSVFEYKKHQEMYDEIISWHNGIVETKLNGEKETLFM